MLQISAGTESIDEKSTKIVQHLAEAKSYSVIVNLMYLDALLQQQDFLSYFVTSTGFIQVPIFFLLLLPSNLSGIPNNPLPFLPGLLQVFLFENVRQTYHNAGNAHLDYIFGKGRLSFAISLSICKASHILNPTRWTATTRA